MKNKRLFESTTEINALADRLSHFERIRRFDNQKHKECGALAVGLSHIEDSCHKILNDCLPQLVSNDLSEDQVCDMLVDLGEEIKHIIFHAQDSRSIETIVGKLNPPWLANDNELTR